MHRRVGNANQNEDVWVTAVKDQNIEVQAQLMNSSHASDLGSHAADALMQPLTVPSMSMCLVHIQHKSQNQDTSPRGQQKH
jgi:hypothetical protein